MPICCLSSNVNAMPYSRMQCEAPEVRLRVRYFIQGGIPQKLNTFERRSRLGRRAILVGNRHDVSQLRSTAAQVLMVGQERANVSQRGRRHDYLKNCPTLYVR